MANSMLNWFTPLPPARNGIADYSAILLKEIARSTPCTCYSFDTPASLPEGVEVRDPLQAFRHIDSGSRILHQIGNNAGHVFVLNALRTFGGTVSLHDLSLLYLYELSTKHPQDLFGHMSHTSPGLAMTYARHWRDHNVKTAANYVLFDFLYEIINLSARVIVHSQYAARKIRHLYGFDSAKVAVIPHFAPNLVQEDSQKARSKLGIPPGKTLIITSGFASRAKRFDWLIEALNILVDQGIDFFWVHVGEERPDEFPLSNELYKKPRLNSMSDVTGYVSEEVLNSYISAADIVVNLRFPSVGESSGTLARAFAAGRCCLVSDTAAYAEIPRDAVIHIPIYDPIPSITQALSALIASPGLRDFVGAGAQKYATTTLSLDSVALSYLDEIDFAYSEQNPYNSAPRVGRESVKKIQQIISMDWPCRISDILPKLPQPPETFTVVIWFASVEVFTESAMIDPEFITSGFGLVATIELLRFVNNPAATRDRSKPAIGLVVKGRINK